jgi:hypothetical protein
MHASASLPSPASLISTACGTCGNNMRLAYVDPTGADTVYAYRCDNGHYHEILRADKKAAPMGVLAIVKPGIGLVSPRSVGMSDLPLSSVTQRDWPSIYMARVSRPTIGRAG